MDGPGVLELRVHGVSGTSPQAALGVRADQIGQVGGDGLTGLYRVRPDAVASGPTMPAHGAVEAYSWGALTSSAGSLVAWVRRSAWLLLLPFALVNVAAWARPGMDAPGRRHVVSAALVRFAGLLLTALLVGTSATVGVDLVAWQCYRGGRALCDPLPGWLPLARDPFDEPARRLALGSLLPLVLLVLLVLLTRTTVRRYEMVTGPPLPGRARSRTPMDSRALLQRPGMWDGAERVVALTRLHLATGLLVTAAVAGWPVAVLAGDGLLRLLVRLAAVLAAVVIGTTMVGSYDQVEWDGGPCPRWRRRAPRVLLLLSAALLAAVELRLLLPRHAVDENGDLPLSGVAPLTVLLILFGVTALLVGVHRAPVGWPCAVLLVGIALAVVYATAHDQTEWLLASGVLLLATVVSISWQRTWRPDPACCWDGAAPAVLVGGATLVAILFSSSLLLLAADRLGDGGVIHLQTRHLVTEPRLPLQRPGDTEVLPAMTRVRLVGPVELVGGALELDGDRAVVRGGRLHARAWARVDGTVRTPLPSGGLSGPVEVSLAQPVLAVRGTCLDGGAARDAVVEVAALTVEQGTGACGPSAPRVLVADEPGEGALVLPNPWVWLVTVVPLFLLSTVVALGVALAWFGRRAAPGIRALSERELPGEVAPSGARVSAARVHRAEALLGLVAACAVVSALLATGGALSNRAPWELSIGGRAVPRGVTQLGLLTALALAAALVAVGARMRSSDSLRRGIGVLWDLATFWPRVAHPFGPPCYGERVVPELVARVRWAAATHPETRVVLSGHSQGSTICAAVLEQLADETCLRQVHLVTYGSQLRAWFGRAFPGVLGPQVLGNEPTSRPLIGSASPDVPPTPSQPHRIPPASLAGRLGVGTVAPRWVNLFRRTDPLGFRVLRDSDADNALDRVVREVPPPSAGDPAALVQTHSRYPESPDYAAAVSPWLTVPGAGSGSRVADVPFLRP